MAFSGAIEIEDRPENELGFQGFLTAAVTFRVQRPTTSDKSKLSFRLLDPKKRLPLHSTTTGKIFEKNSSFHVKQHTTGKVQFLFSRSLLLVLAKFSFWEEEWALGYNSMKF